MKCSRNKTKSYLRRLTAVNPSTTSGTNSPCPGTVPKLVLEHQQKAIFKLKAMGVVLLISFARVFLPTGVILYQTQECGNNCQERQHLSVRVFLSAVGLPDYIVALSRPFPRTASVSETVLCLTF